MRIALNRARMNILFLAIFAIVLIFPLPLPVTVTQYVQDIYDNVEAFPDGAVVMVNMYVAPEHLLDGSVYPCAVGLLQHFFHKDMKVLFASVGTNRPQAPIYAGFVVDPATNVLDTHGGVYGEDFVILPAVAGGVSGLSVWLDDIWGTTPYDYYNNPMSELPMMDTIRSVDDLDLVLCIGFVRENDFRVTSAKHGVPIVVGTTESYAPGLMPYVLTGQSIGILYGARLAAEYELLVDRAGQGLATMSQFAAIAIVLLIMVVLGNVTAPRVREGASV
jgi:hypothetical protein